MWGPAQLMPLIATVSTTTCLWNPETPPDTGIFICLYAINSMVINVLVSSSLNTKNRHAYASMRSLKTEHWLILTQLLFRLS